MAAYMFIYTPPSFVLKPPDFERELKFLIYLSSDLIKGQFVFLSSSDALEKGKIGCYVFFFCSTVLPKSTANSACFISISNTAHAKYKLSQAPLLN